MSKERRAAQPAEFRADEKMAHVMGHAAVFNQETMIGDYFREVIRPGAFAKSIAGDDIPFLCNHEGLPLARNTSGTLKLSEDNRGLRMESDLDVEDPDVMCIVPKMKRGDLSKMSFQFRALRQEWDDTGEIPLRILHEVQLFDVSIVTMPAYDGTDIGLRSLTEWRTAHPPMVNIVPNIGARLRMRHALRVRELAR